MPHTPSSYGIGSDEQNGAEDDKDDSGDVEQRQGCLGSEYGLPCWELLLLELGV